MLDFSGLDQKTLKKLIERRHPEYAENLLHWDFLESCYKGGRVWFMENIFPYMKEGEVEFADRVRRAYRFNHSREVVDIVNKYLFKSGIIRNESDAPQIVKNFWQKTTRNGLNIDQFMKLVSMKSSCLGRVWIAVDSTVPQEASGEMLTVEDERQLGAMVYAYIITPQNVLDVAFDDEGNINWILIHEIARDDANPLKSTGALMSRYRLWTTEQWFLFQQTLIGPGNKTRIELIEEGVNNLGMVPIFPVDNTQSDDLYNAPALIGDIAYLDRAAANYLSNLDAIIQDQTFSQLAMPAQGLLPGEEGFDKLVEMGTKRIFTYDGEHGVSPHYLAPDPKQAGVILDVINKIIAEIYHIVGLSGERTKQDNAVGTDNSSGVAKAYDFERVNALLAAKADNMEATENKLMELVGKYYGQDLTPPVMPIAEGTTIGSNATLVKYPDDFDVRGLYDEFEIAERLALIEAPADLRRLQMSSVIDKLYPRLSTALKQQMQTALKEWPPAPDPALTSQLIETPGKAPTAMTKLQSQGPSPAPGDVGQQGQNNKGDKSLA